MPAMQAMGPAGQQTGERGHPPALDGGDEPARGEAIDLQDEQAALRPRRRGGAVLPAQAVEHGLEERVGLVQAQPADHRGGHHGHHQDAQHRVVVAVDHQRGVPVGGPLEDQRVEQQRRQAQGQGVERQRQEQQQGAQQDHQDRELHRHQEHHQPPAGRRGVDVQAAEQAGGQQQGQQVDQPDQRVPAQDAPESPHVPTCPGAPLRAERRSPLPAAAIRRITPAPRAAGGRSPAVVPAAPSRRRSPRCASAR